MNLSAWLPRRYFETILTDWQSLAGHFQEQRDSSSAAEQVTWILFHRSGPLSSLFGCESCAFPFCRTGLLCSAAFVLS